MRDRRVVSIECAGGWDQKLARARKRVTRSMRHGCADETMKGVIVRALCTAFEHNRHLVTVVHSRSQQTCQTRDISCLGLTQ